MDDLLREFLTETAERIAGLDQELVKLERNPDDPALLSGIFRLIHTIKGTCGFLGLPRLEAVAHAAENVLCKFRDDEVVVTPTRVNVILHALDCIKGILDALDATGVEPTGDDAPLIAALNACAAAAETGQPGTTAFSKPATMAEDHAESTLGNQSVRVDLDLLDGLMASVAELILVRNDLLQVARTFPENKFLAPLHRLDLIVAELQETVMKTRMQPIESAWSKLPRLIRDLSQELGKKIEFEMHGAETELDRQVLELVRDPLMHMVRNSADHGIELPEERRRAGKPETGHIRLNAFHQGGSVVIEVSDDGRGLDLDRIKAKILAKGLASQRELAMLSEAEIQQFIFRPGFTTAETVTAVSGRGVGLDVVRTNIERLGGDIQLRSDSGRGSTIKMKIPLLPVSVSYGTATPGAGKAGFDFARPAPLPLAIRLDVARAVD